MGRWQAAFPLLRLRRDCPDHINKIEIYFYATIIVVLLMAPHQP